MADTGMTFKLFGIDVSASRALEGVGRKARQTGEQVEGHAKRLGGLGTAVAVGLGTAFGGFAVQGVTMLGGALIQGVKDAQDYQTLAQATAGVLKSTGNAANTSVPHVQALAGSLESLSGVDETLIINGQDVLATFTGIRNETGKGNDIFDQATKASLNLSVAMKQDMKSSAVQVGKALNDPIKGITALSRVGVSFTAQQKEQIKALVASGDKMGAQKIILGELNKEFGNAAKAAGQGFGGSMARLKDLVGDTFRSLGTMLIPILTRLADWLTTTAVPAVIAFGQQVGPMLMPILQGLGTIVRALATWFMTQLVPAIQRAAQEVLPAIRSAIKSVTDTFHDHQDVVRGVVTVLKLLGTFITAVLWPVLGRLVVILISMIGPAFRVTIVVLGLVVGAISKVVGAVSAVISWFQRLPGYARSAINAVKTVWNGLVSFVRSIPGRISAAVSGMWNGLTSGFRSAINTIIGWWNRLHFGVPSFDLGPLHVSGFDVGVPQIPYLASGGIVTRPTLAMIGEAGPEAVVPLSRSNGLGGDIHVHIHNAVVGNEQQVARAVTEALRRTSGRGLSFGSI